MMGIKLRKWRKVTGRRKLLVPSPRAIPYHKLSHTRFSKGEKGQKFFPIINRGKKGLERLSEP